MTINDLKELALHTIRGTVPATYTNQNVDMNQAFVDGFNELCGNYYDFMKNKYDIYRLISEVADEALPPRVLGALGAFAEIKTVNNGDKVVFHKRLGKMRAKKFLTQVGINGVYETFRLDNEEFTIDTHAVGGGARIDLQRLADGAESLSEYMDIINEGLVDAVYLEVQKALRAAINAEKRPDANKYSHNGWSAPDMIKLINTVRAYGNGAVIFACPEFVAAMGVDVIVAPATGVPGVNKADLDDIRNTGYITMFRGAPIIQMKQGFVDETNTATLLDPQMAYIFPTGGEKVVKVALEGGTIVRDYTNYDGSMEVFVEKKLGVAILTHNNWAIYQNTGITQTMA